MDTDKLVEGLLTEDSPETDRISGDMMDIHRELNAVLREFSRASGNYSSGGRKDTDLQKFKAVVATVKQALSAYKAI